MKTTTCPKPFLSASNYPPTGGELSTRFCANVTDGLTCCLPCPLTDWVFADDFEKQIPAANYVAIVSLICTTLLLLTFAVLPEEKSHRHYLSVGVTVSLLLLSLAFIIPLGTKPDYCYNDITFDDMHTDVGCAWTGALLLAGAMGTVVWIFIRSIWTALRIIFDFKRTEIFKWVSITLGVGLPALFLAVTMPVAGVSYRLGNVCLPNGFQGFLSWYLWLLVFAGLSAIILISTSLYCFWKFATIALAGAAATTHHSTKSTDSALSDTPASGQPPSRRAARRRKRVEWARIEKVLYLQWRTIVLAFVILNETIYFALVFIQSTMAQEAAAHGLTPADDTWGACLITTGGNKDACLGQSGGLGLSGPRVVATWLLLSTLPIVVSLLMLRQSMFIGWYELLRNPRKLLAAISHRRPSVDSQDFIMQTTPKHVSLTKPLGSEEVAKPEPEPESTADRSLSDVEVKEHDEKDEAEVMV